MLPRSRTTLGLPFARRCPRLRSMPFGGRQANSRMCCTAEIPELFAPTWRWRSKRTRPVRVRAIRRCGSRRSTRRSWRSTRRSGRRNARRSGPRRSGRSRTSILTKQWPQCEVVLRKQALAMGTPSSALGAGSSSRCCSAAPGPMKQSGTARPRYPTFVGCFAPSRRIPRPSDGWRRSWRRSRRRQRPRLPKPLRPQQRRTLARPCRWRRQLRRLRARLAIPVREALALAMTAPTRPSAPPRARRGRDAGARRRTRGTRMRRRRAPTTTPSPNSCLLRRNTCARTTMRARCRSTATCRAAPRSGTPR
mmetsp:Transcript_54545/g.157740  ORF Transcript_54545/g.157740 Transcript_54545/m.157740 type:complete len:307 (+) Transcript_54545:563-1483(+)